MNDSVGTRPERLTKWQTRAGFSELPEKAFQRIQTISWKDLDADTSAPAILWLGHASFMIQWKGLRIMLDPVFSRHVGIIPRRWPLPVNWQEMKPDYILLSHAHMDHLDISTLNAYSQANLVIPAGSERFLTKEQRLRSKSASLGQVFKIGEFRISTVPARHGGWRYPWQRGCQALGYVLSDGHKTIFYAGDSAYGEHFSEIGADFDIDIALLPIGAYAPQWFLQKRHLNPEEAVATYKDCNARRMIPFHFGAYRLSLEPLHEPLPRFVRHAATNGCDWFLPVGI